jgi:hypothetical protein
MVKQASAYLMTDSSIAEMNSSGDHGILRSDSGTDILQKKAFNNFHA